MAEEERRMLVGVDVGGTKIEAVAVDDAGTVLGSERVPARPGADLVVDDVVAAVTVLCERVGRTLSAVGVGIPGQVDSARGIVRSVVNLDIDELYLADRLRERLGVPACVENDVNAAALGAAVVLGEVGSGGDGSAEPSPVVLLNLGTGLAAGVVERGRIRHGFSGALGEVGHIPVDPNQLPCPCGQRGCLETVASGGAVCRLWPQADPPMPDVLRRAAEGEGEAIRVRDIVTHAIVDALQIVVQAYDPRRVVIAGGMAKTGQPLLDAIAQQLQVREQSCPFLTGLRIMKRVSLVPSSEPVGGIGAALAARSRVAQ